MTIENKNPDAPELEDFKDVFNYRVYKLTKDGDMTVNEAIEFLGLETESIGYSPRSKFKDFNPKGYERFNELQAKISTKK